MFGKSCGEDNVKPGPVVVERDSLFDILRIKYNYEVGRLTDKISRLEALKSQRVIVYKERVKNVPQRPQDSLKWAMGNWQECDTILQGAEELIKSRGDLIRADSVWIKGLEKKVGELKTEKAKTDIILMAVQGKFERENERKKRWRIAAFAIAGAVVVPILKNN